MTPPILLTDPRLAFKDDPQNWNTLKSKNSRFGKYLKGLFRPKRLIFEEATFVHSESTIKGLRDTYTNYWSETKANNLPRLIHRGAIVQNAALASGVEVGELTKVVNCEIGGSSVIHQSAVIRNSLLASEVEVGEHSKVRSCKIGGHSAIHRGAIVQNAALASEVEVGEHSKVRSCKIGGHSAIRRSAVVENSDLGFGVEIRELTEVKSCKIDEQSIVDRRTVVSNYWIGKNVILGSECVIKQLDPRYHQVIGDRVKIGQKTQIDNAKIHSDCQIGEEVLIQHDCGLEDSVHVGDRTEIGHHSWISEGVEIGEDVKIGIKCIIKMNNFIPDGTIIPDGAEVANGTYPKRFLKPYLDNAQSPNLLEQASTSSLQQVVPQNGLTSLSHELAEKLIFQKLRMRLKHGFALHAPLTCDHSPKGRRFGKSC